MYKFDWVENKETKETAIQIKEGPYADTIFIFKNSKVKLTDERGEPLDLENIDKIPIDFDYEILYSITGIDIYDSEFKNAIGDIFMQLLFESVHAGSYKLNEN